MLSKTSAPQTKSFSPSKALLGIFFIALAFRLWGVTNPLLDFHAWRQTLTATLSYNFYAEGMNFLNPSPNRLNQLGAFEFPLYTYIVAILYKVFGFHEIIGRLVAIAFSMGSIWFLYLLGKRYFDETSAMLACGFYAVLPFCVYYSRTFMPESAMLFFSISMLYMFTRWLDTGKWNHFFIASLLATLAFLVKLPTLYMGGPLLFLAWNKFRGKIIYQFPLYLFVILTLAPPALWYSYVSQLHYESSGESNLWLSLITNWDVLSTLRYWKLIFWTRLVEKMFTFTAFPFLILGMLRARENKEQLVLHIWFFSVCAYFIIAARLNFMHEYYQVPIIPVGCLFIGKYLADFFRQRSNTNWKADKKVWLVALMIVFIPLHSIYKLNNRLHFNDSYLKISTAVQQVTLKTDRLVVEDVSASPRIFYYSQRKGWGYSLNDKILPSLLEGLIKKGATHYVMANFNLQEKNPKLRSFLQSNHQLLLQKEYVTIYKLSNN
jgi:4-amino-4-deoxy-L-arabinose transferase-like glycosyltransferase